MKRDVLAVLLSAAAFWAATAGAAAPDAALKNGPNKERLVLDDMEDVSDWGNGSPEETTISADAQYVKEGRLSLKFANLVDHTRGEKNYPVGWPRTRKALSKTGPTDWSGYDFFECWIYAGTSRPSLPGTPLGIGFYHSGPKRSTGVSLDDVKKDSWAKIVIPIAEMEEAADVQAVQFHISEANYRHGDRVDFFIDEMVLTRFIHPVIAGFEPRRKLLYQNDRHVMATYALMGRQGMDGVTVRLAIAADGQSPVAQSTAAASREGELTLAIDKPLEPGDYQATLALHRRGRDGAPGEELDRRQTAFRVIEGPFER